MFGCCWWTIGVVMTSLLVLVDVVDDDNDDNDDNDVCTLIYIVLDGSVCFVDSLTKMIHMGGY